MLAVALKDVFRTALTGRCDARPELARDARSRSRSTSRRCRAAAAPTCCAGCSSRWAGRSRRPPSRSTRRFPEWGDSRYVDLRLTGAVRLADALNHLYVLLPVLDDAKHYWVSTDEVDKLIRAGGGLAGRRTPRRRLITRRYLAHRRELTRVGAGPAGRGRRHRARASSTTPSTARSVVDEPDRPVPLAEQRRGAVLAAVRAAGARTRRRPRLRRGRAACATCSPSGRIEQGRRRRRVGPRAADRRAPAAAGPDDRARSGRGSRSSSRR